MSHKVWSSLAMVIVLIGTSSADYLHHNYYQKSCPKVFTTVQSAVESAVANEKRMGASLLRLHFHDCFVQGCDASLLLDDTPTFTGEQTALPNNNSIRGLDVVDSIKAKVEEVCPGVVSCADILAIAARDSVVELGGPSWKVKLGRKDSLTASLALANSGVIPPPTATVGELRKRFSARGLSIKDLVVLSGAHTIGQARCTVFRGRIYNETNIDPSFARTRQSTCPRTPGNGDNNLAPFDITTPNRFDNAYYKNLVNQKGLLHTDQLLNNDSTTRAFVNKYSRNPWAFEKDFVAAMIRMGDNRPPAGSRGEVRLNCGRPN